MARTSRKKRGARKRSTQLQRLTLNRGGYSPGKFGKYFGAVPGTRIFEYYNDENGKHRFVRATSRQDAEAQLRSIDPEGFNS